MQMGLLSRIKERFKVCCPQLKAFILTRRAANGEPPGGEIQCKINCDLSDKRTFFAWQRNHMANERTFLSWCRTGISLIAFGFVIERFDILIREMRIFAAHPGMANLRGTGYLGMTAFLLGAIIVVLAGWRFFYIRRHINKGETEFSVLPDVFLMGSVLLTVLTAVVFFAFFF
jgi:putative membrane protein